jgi:formylglycine-generating enzyme required for sulfatase activity
MKILLVSCCFVAFLASTIQHARGSDYKSDTTPSTHSKWVGSFSKKSIKKREHALKGFQFMQGGAFASSKPHESIGRRPENDTTLIIDMEPGKRLSIASFYLSKKEVSNLEYRTFVNWVIDSIALSILASKDPGFYLDPTQKTLNWSRRGEARDTNQFENLFPLYIPNPKINTFNSDNRKFILNVSAVLFSYTEIYHTIPTSIAIYPDTLCWIRDVVYNFNEPLTRHYFQHTDYNNYPVVGVSWKQAYAYCRWLGLDGKGAYRLPTQAEILYCYISFPKINSRSKPISSNRFERIKCTYPWSTITEELVDKQGKYLANSGSLTDEYEVKHKDFAQDGALFTSACGSYPVSPTGLYDLAGNVAEWVADGFVKELMMGDDLSMPRNRYYTTRATPLVFDSIVDRLFGLYRSNSARKQWINLGKPKMIPKPIDMFSSPDRELYDILVTANNIFSSYQVINSLEEPKMVVGGSWMESPSMMRFGEKRAFSADATHSFIGFRVAADVTESLAPFLPHFQGL